MSQSSAMRAADPTYDHVLVPLDGSELAARATPTARALAVRFGAELQSIGVASSSGELQSLRDQAADALAIDADDAPIHVEVADDPALAIRRRADALGSCLVCMSSHGRGRVSGAIVGSVARAVLEAGAEPIVVVGPAVPRPSDTDATPALSADTMIACVDGGEASEQVLPVAAAWAHALSLRLNIVTVAEPVPPPLRADASWHRHHGPDAEPEKYVVQLTERWRAEVPDVRGEAVYDRISAAEGIEAYLGDHPAALLALTTHARRGLDRVVFGAGAAAIVKSSTAPALVVPLRP
jgi:nucleotide-binding universal stress UspA family protein